MTPAINDHAVDCESLTSGNPCSCEAAECARENADAPEPEPCGPRYRCEWEGAANPTAGMSETDAAAYWKTHDVRGSAVFACRDPYLPVELGVLWLDLADRIGTGPETAAHRRRAGELRKYYRVWAALADPYPMPAESFDPEPAAAYLAALPEPIRRPASKAPAVNWKARALAAELELAALKEQHVLRAVSA